MDFVTFEIAKKLKEKGFPQGNENDITEKYYTISDSLKSAIMLANNEDVKWYCPTISQVLKLLRENKSLYIEIYMYHNCYLWEIYNTEMYDIDYFQKSEKYSEIEYKTYEEAALAGIEYVLDNLI